MGTLVEVEGPRVVGVVDAGPASGLDELQALLRSPHASKAVVVRFNLAPVCSDSTCRPIATVVQCFHTRRMEADPSSSPDSVCSCLTHELPDRFFFSHHGLPTSNHNGIIPS